MQELFYCLIPACLIIISKIQIADFDGDGKSDIGGAYYQSLSGLLYAKFAFAKVHESHYSYQTYDVPNLYVNGNLEYFPDNIDAVGDFDGDGHADLFSPVGGGPYSFYYFKPFSTSYLLATVTNGFGETTSFNYTDLAGEYHQWIKPDYYQLPSYSSSDALMNYPYNIISPPIFVVSSVTTSNGIGGVYKSDYRYKDLIFHRAGKGLLGFKNITINNEVLGTTTEVYNDVNIQYATSYQTKQLTKLNSTGETLSEQDVTTTFVDKSTNGYFDKRFSPQVEK